MVPSMSGNVTLMSNIISGTVGSAISICTWVRCLRNTAEIEVIFRGLLMSNDVIEMPVLQMVVARCKFIFRSESVSLNVKP